ncbi:hypothetical protein [Thalassospira sp. GB04J01]|uniref:hypothetical protein n=1 Tax=Thalassospira sp. GB04J01 TaxID=1485225 RepID=UPI000C9C64D0|nr:hypothetical protein [Thalassospira sp. GB04J01]
MPQLNFSIKSESYLTADSITLTREIGEVASSTYINSMNSIQNPPDHYFLISARSTKSEPYELVVDQSVQISENSTTANPTQHTDFDPLSMIQYRDTWLNNCLEAINAHKHLKDGWDGALAPAPENASLTTAEFLALGFSYLDSHLRPSFSVDSEGCPGFSLYNDHIYLHLTIDAPELISWYVVKDKQESFGDDVLVNGINFVTVAAKILK